jgi:hypothetical protein
LYSPSIWNFYNNEQMQWVAMATEKEKKWNLMVG